MLFFHWEGLVYAIRYSCFFFQTTSARIVEELQEIAFSIGHLSWDADLVAVEVVGLLAAFGNQSVEDVVGKAVARTVFITDG